MASSEMLLQTQMRKAEFSLVELHEQARLLPQPVEGRLGERTSTVERFPDAGQGLELGDVFLAFPGMEVPGQRAESIA